MRSIHVLALMLAAATLGFAGPAPAEPVAATGEALHVAPGSKVKLTFPSEWSVEGTLLALDDQQVTVRIGDRTRSYGRREVESFSVSRGSHSRGHGAAIGFGAGYLTGIVVGLASGDDPGNQIMALDAGSKAAIFGLGLGIVGGAIGLLAPPGERWEQLPVGGAHFGLGPVPASAVGASVALKF